jgi:TPR repeat protein
MPFIIGPIILKFSIHADLYGMIGDILRFSQNQKCIYCYVKAAKFGSNHAALTLGEIYLQVDDYIKLPKNYTEGFKWYEMAAHHHPLLHSKRMRRLNNEARLYALNDLGYLYSKGYGTLIDPKKAMDCYQKAALLGSAVAKYNIGYHYLTGVGVAQNYQMAIHYFQMAAQEGDICAMHDLGLMYTKGLGVEKNKQAAMKSFAAATANLQFSKKLISFYPIYQLTKINYQFNDRQLTEHLSNKYPREAVIVAKKINDFFTNKCH